MVLLSVLRDGIKDGIKDEGVKLSPNSVACVGPCVGVAVMTSSSSSSSSFSSSFSSSSSLKEISSEEGQKALPLLSTTNPGDPSLVTHFSKELNLLNSSKQVL